MECSITANSSLQLISSDKSKFVINKNIELLTPNTMSEEAKNKAIDGVIKMTSEIKPSALKVAMGYRGVSQTELRKNIKGLSQSNVSRFLKGYYGAISEMKLKEIMQYLNFPFEFLYNDFPPLQTSNGIIK